MCQNCIQMHYFIAFNNYFLVNNTNCCDKIFEFQTQGNIFLRDRMKSNCFVRRFYNFSRDFHRLLLENDQRLRKITPNATKCGEIRQK